MLKHNYSHQKNQLPNSQILNRLHLETKKTWKQLADVYGVSERTIRRKAKPSNKPKQKRGRRLKIDDNSLKLLTSYVFRNKTTTQQSMADYFAQQTGQSISQQTISRTLQKSNITRKKTTYQYSEQINQITNIGEFINTVNLLPQPHLLAMDECSFHLNEAPRYGYFVKGFRAISQRPGKRGLNHTLILCIQNIKGKGVIHYQLIEGGVKAQSFHDFIKGINLPTNEKYYLLLDNLRVHHAVKSCRKLGLPTVKELLASKNIEPIYLPPYTPETNPTELCFNIIRQKVEEYQPRTFEELKLAIDKIINILNQKDLSQFFRHCMSYRVGEYELLNEKDYNVALWVKNFVLNQHYF